MNSRSKTVVAILVLAIVIAGIYLIRNKNNGEGNTQTNTLKTYSDPVTGISFKYNEVFPYKYIHPEVWPPIAQVKDDAFVCAEKTGPMPTTTVEKIVVNNRIYCLTTIPGGAAAGTFYASYEHRFSEMQKVVQFSLTLGFVTCQNYEEPYVSECLNERESFDVNKVIDQIRNTVKLSNPTNTGITGISGDVLLGPVCPLAMMDSPNPECADKPYRANLVLISDQGRIVKNFSSNSEGKFIVAVEPGEYLIRSEIPNALPNCGTDPIQVLQGTTTQVIVHCDTGIR